MAEASSLPASRFYLDARLEPNQSLSRRGLWLLLGALAVYNLLVMGFLLAIGATPVPIFLGLDFVGVAIAFRVHRRRGAEGERVRVSADLVEVARTGPAEREHRVWASPTAFTRVALERAAGGADEVRLRLSRRSLAIGAGLAPDARLRLVETLRRAIAEARAERYGP